jgi:hypothetical protein
MPMRRSWSPALLALASLFAAARAEARPARPGAEEAVKTVEAYNTVEADARLTALELGEKEAQKLVRARFAPLGWQPPEERVEKEYLEKRRVLQVEVTEKVKRLDGDYYKAVCRVDLNDDYLGELGQLAREHRMVQRHLLAGRVLAGLVVLLLVVWSYLRLEDATRGYYTRLLRVGALGLVALTAALLWLAF